MMNLMVRDFKNIEKNFFLIIKHFVLIINAANYSISDCSSGESNRSCFEQNQIQDSITRGQHDQEVSLKPRLKHMRAMRGIFQMRSSVYKDKIDRMKSQIKTQIEVNKSISCDFKNLQRKHDFLMASEKKLVSRCAKLKKQLRHTEKEKAEAQKNLIDEIRVNTGLKIHDAGMQSMIVILENELRQARMELEAIRSMRPSHDNDDNLTNFDTSSLTRENEFLKALVRQYGHQVEDEQRYF